MSAIRPPIHLAAWVLATALLACAAGLELERVASGRLFLFETSYDAAASVVEERDAALSAAQWRYPAIAAVLCFSCLVFALTRDSVQRVRPAKVVVVVFLWATAFDLFTTLRFFHFDGIDTELHPGVRLLSYAYGRTVGPVLAKTVQASGVLFLASRLPTISKPLLIGTSIVYTAAAVHNAM